MVAVTVVSVGPYALSTRTCGARARQAASAAAGTDSPPRISRRSGAREAAVRSVREKASSAQYVGGRFSTVIPYRSTTRGICAGSHCSSGRTTRVAPQPSAVSSWSSEASKEKEEKASTRSRAVIPNSSRAAATCASIAPCSMPTAFGRPVEPEVKMTYARSRGSGVWCGAPASGSASSTRSTRGPSAPASSAVAASVMTQASAASSAMNRSRSSGSAGSSGT